MARPSIKKQRFEEILDAFEICVTRYGLAGATLEQVAKQAQLARPLIRHHIGNKDKLVNALIKRFNQKSKRYIQQVEDDLPQANRFSHLIDRLFDQAYFDANLVLLTEALIAAAVENPDLAKQLKQCVDSIINLIIRELNIEYPNRSQKSIKIVATGILGIYFNVDSFAMLGNMDDLRENSKHAAELLAHSLDA